MYEYLNAKFMTMTLFKVTKRFKLVGYYLDLRNFLWFFDRYVSTIFSEEKLKFAEIFRKSFKS